MSGSVHWKKDGYENQIPWIENQISSIDFNTTHLYSYIAVGELENEPLLTANRRLYKALKKIDTKPLMKSSKADMTVFGGENLFDGLKALKLTKTHYKIKGERIYESRRTR